MPDQATQTAEKKSTSTLPEPRHPAGGVSVDAAAVPFSWSEVPGVKEYVLQVARDGDFQDVVLTVTAGDTTNLTLYSTLEAAEADYHWRVRAGKKAPWGPAECFRPSGEERLMSERMERERRAHVEAARELQSYLDSEERVPVAIPTDQEIGERGTVVVLSVIVISFILLLVLLMIFGQVTYPAEAVT